jgi:hypothetical protein
MKPSIRSATLAALLALALAACGGSPAADAPAATPASASEAGSSSNQPAAQPKPTAAPLPTTAPTATPEPAAADVSLADALANAQEIKTYRMEMEMSSSGMLDALAQAGGATEGAASDADVPLMSMAGEFDNGNSHFTMKGLFVGFMGIDPEQGLEMLTVDGKTYVHGPVPMMGAADDAWYVTDSAQQAASAPVDSGAFFEAFGGQDLSKFEQIDTDSLDGQSCAVYLGDEAATQAVFQSTAGGSAEGMDEIESAELKIWACDDGFVHQMQINMVGTAEDSPDQKIDMNMNFHLYDFDSADIAIEAPENAQPLATPSFEMPTTEE